MIYIWFIYSMDLKKSSVMHTLSSSVSQIKKINLPEPKSIKLIDKVGKAVPNAATI